jgi:hypothetical protein
MGRHHHHHDDELEDDDELEGGDIANRIVDTITFVGCAFALGVVAWFAWDAWKRARQSQPVESAADANSAVVFNQRPTTPPAASSEPVVVDGEASTEDGGAPGEPEEPTRVRRGR